MSDEDNRIQLPPTPVDFSVFGTTGQAHDTFPAPGQQPRYDWMRAVLIGLLANQASSDEPTQFRTGTLWYNKSTDAIMVYNGTEWANLAAAILLKLTDESEEGETLTEFYRSTMDRLSSVYPRYTYSGVISTAAPTYLPVPESISTPLAAYVSVLRPIIWVNGLLIDPRLYDLTTNCPCIINLSPTFILSVNDKFTVVIERFDGFASEDVTV